MPDRLVAESSVAEEESVFTKRQLGLQVGWGAGNVGCAVTSHPAVESEIGLVWDQAGWLGLVDLV